MGITRVGPTDLKEKFQNLLAERSEIFRLGIGPRTGWRAAALAAVLGVAISVCAAAPVHVNSSDSLSIAAHSQVGHLPSTVGPQLVSLKSFQSGIIQQVLDQQVTQRTGIHIASTLTNSIKEIKGLSSFATQSFMKDADANFKSLTEDDETDIGMSSTLNFKDKDALAANADLSGATCHVHIPQVVTGEQIDQTVWPIAEKMAQDWGVSVESTYEVVFNAYIGMYGVNEELGPERSAQAAAFTSAFFSGHEAGHCAYAINLIQDLGTAQRIDKLAHSAKAGDRAALRVLYAQEMTPDIIGIKMSLESAHKEGASHALIAGWIKALGDSRITLEDSPDLEKEASRAIYRDAGRSTIGASQAILRGEKIPDKITPNVVEGYFTAGVLQAGRDLLADKTLDRDVKNNSSTSDDVARVSYLSQPDARTQTTPRTSSSQHRM